MGKPSRGRRKRNLFGRLSFRDLGLFCRHGRAGAVEGGSMNEEVKMIPLAKIRILNPRHRDKKKFQVVVESIKTVGLKKPIQVSRRGAQESAEEEGYDLVCGQGRIEAFMALGYTEIPAIVVDVSKEERMLRSLIENMARRYPTPLALMIEIERLKELSC